jgi:hypothetical protein
VFVELMPLLGESQSRPERKEAGRCSPEGAGARKCHTHRTKYDLICGGTEVISDNMCGTSD